jgi:uncharacterized protein (DUF4415 family)
MMIYQATFRLHGDKTHVPVEAESHEQAVYKAYAENPILQSWKVSVRLLKEGEQPLDDRAVLEFVEDRKPGRPKGRKGEYERITLEIRKDLLAKIDASGKSRREYIEKLLEQM